MSSKIKPFSLRSEDSLTEVQKRAAIDFKEFGNNFRKFDDEEKMHNVLRSMLFVSTMINTKRYFEYNPESKIS